MELKHVWQSILDMPHRFAQARMRKNPSSFIGDGFFDKKLKILLFPSFKQPWKTFWIGKRLVRHDSHKRFARRRLRMS